VSLRERETQREKREREREKEREREREAQRVSLGAWCKFCNLQVVCHNWSNWQQIIITPTTKCVFFFKFTANQEGIFPICCTSFNSNRASPLL
jgi:hypothetical protein